MGSKVFNKELSDLFPSSFFIVLLSALLFGCQDHSEDSVIHISGPTMGTTYNITLVDPPKNLVQENLQQQIDQELLSLNQQMSTYIDDSEIMQFNRAPQNHWMTVSSDFLAVVQLSQVVSGLSQGRFDITVGPLVELWGFGKRVANEVPSNEQIAAVKTKVGWQKLKLDSDRQALSKSIPLKLDVSAVAKGYAVDKLFSLIKQQEVQNFLVEIGGEMRVQGSNGKQQPWRIGIEKPSLLQKQAQQLVHLSNKAIATSGDYRNYFEDQGQRYSHTIDPESGYPVRHNIASVTVISDTAAEADALATALNVMGETAAKTLARRKNLAVFFIFYDNQSNNGYRTEYTPAFSVFLP